jgi:hypothetical protein
MPGLRARIRSISSQNCGARADRRRWSARPGSKDRDRGSDSSKARVSDACRPTVSLPWAIGKRRQDRCFRAARRSCVPLNAGLSEQAAEELDVLANAQVRVEVLAETLRHVGDARADRGAMPRRAISPPRTKHASGLNLREPRDKAQQRRLAHAVRPDQSRPCRRLEFRS